MFDVEPIVQHKSEGNAKRKVADQGQVMPHELNKIGLNAAYLRGDSPVKNRNNSI